MAGKRAKRSTSKRKSTTKPKLGLLRRLRRLVLRLVVIGVALVLAAVAFYAVINPPTTHTIWTESRRLGGVTRAWVDIEDVAPVMARSVVAAEDANFCAHWGFDMDAIRAAISSGARRGGSTISQQVVKNAYLWQGRSWVRKAMEAGMTPLVEGIWSKRRILEVYLNIAEFDEGVFGIDAAARHYFDVPPDRLTPGQAARLAVVLPSPKRRDAARLSGGLRQRAASVEDGAATIARDGRAACFEEG